MRNNSIASKLAVRNAVFDHPIFASALLDFQKDIEDAKSGFTGLGRLLLGQSGSGKSTLVRKLMSHANFNDCDEKSERTCIRLELADSTTHKSIVKAIYGEMGYKFRNRMTAEDYVSEISLKIERLGIRAIIIDEAHHIFSPKYVRKYWHPSQKVMPDPYAEVDKVPEFVKSLINRIPCALFLVGIPHLELLHLSPQMNRRLNQDVELVPYDWGIAEERFQFCSLLARYENLLGINTGLISTPEIAVRFYVATQGQIGFLSKLLCEAIDEAERCGSEPFEIETLANAYSKWFKPPDRLHSIDFERIKPMSRGISLHQISDYRRARSLADSDNPFKCSVADLTRIFRQTLTRSLEAGQQQCWSPPNGRSKGLGPATPRAFKRK